MKKANASSVISTFIVTFIFWMLITGQLSAVFRGQPSVEVLIAGVIVCLLTSLFSAKFFIHEKAFWLLNPARLGSFLLYCCVIFPIELIKANVDVAIKALSPKLNIHPGIVKVPSELKSEYGQAMLANSITLTPGTITLDLAEDLEEEAAATNTAAATTVKETAAAGSGVTPAAGTDGLSKAASGRLYYYIHWLDMKTTDHAEAGEQIKGTMEKHIRRIWE
ncbi:MAG: Na+/H+ antiporter subunit E [Lachnospiraceae bacterium]|nr:Na+/H+ antiporter subunit E [Lachnospiraceae bacterium]